jgi:hypothetical protein
MRGRYYLKIVTTTGEVKNLQIGYFPNMGRMELAVWDSDN